MPACLDQRVGVLVWSPLAFGLLGGKYRRGEAAPADARLSAWGSPGTLDEQSWAIVDEVRAIAESRNVSPAQVALNWLVHRPAVTSVIVGARNSRQLADNLQAAAWRLSDDELARLDRVSARPLLYPYWHQKKYNSERQP